MADSNEASMTPMSFVMNPPPGSSGTASSEFEHLLSDLNDLQTVTRGRGDLLDNLEATVERTGEAVEALEQLVDNLQTELEAAQQQLEQLEEHHQQLQTDQEKLDQTGHQLYQRVKGQDQQLHDVKVSDNNQDVELTRSRFLRDEVRDDLYRKEDDLHIAQRRLDQQNMHFFQLFEDLKMDVTRQRRESRPMLDELQNLDHSTISRLQQYLAGENVPEEERMIAERLCSFYCNNTEYRNLYNEVGDLEFEMRTSDRALEFSQGQVKSKLLKMERLEQDLSATRGVFGMEEGTHLKITTRCVDLAGQAEMGEDMRNTCWSEDEEEEGVVPEEDHLHCGGRGLHRCGKITDIRVSDEEEEEEEQEQEQEVDVDVEVEMDQLEVEDAALAETPQDSDFDKEKQIDTPKVYVKEKLPQDLKTDKASTSDASALSAKPHVGATLEGANAAGTDAIAEKAMSALSSNRGLGLSRDSRSSFVKPAHHKVELRATGSSATYASTTGRSKKK